MPRSSRSSRPAQRPAAAPAQQSRGAHTAAMPPQAAHANPAHAPAPTAQSGQPGLLTQMAATAGSVAVGSTIGHGISHMLFGGSNSATTAEPAAPVQQQSFQSTPACDTQAKDFTRCLDKADLQSCSYYLEQLKACQAAAAQYS
ncbi:hypothetical protein J3R82DRAFT_6875 [Butyriboletus roseoflavus]|nr:hypothetical protein J3R82DRAFT_6875 [Butyriboletus roseoflavus]